MAWILKTIQELKLQPPPAVAIMPLGTGNDLSLSFGWGNTFLQPWIRDYKTLYATLKRVADAEVSFLRVLWSLFSFCIRCGGVLRFVCVRTERHELEFVSLIAEASCRSFIVQQMQSSGGLTTVSHLCLSICSSCREH